MHLWQPGVMQLAPRYGSTSVVDLDGPPSGIAAPTVRQRRRLLEAVSSFDDAQWAHPSRCAGWTARDVILHLDSTNSFWAYSIMAGLKGEPSRFLTSFDPVASPAQMVAGEADIAPSAVLQRFTASTEQLEAVLLSLDDVGWTTLAEAPPGHITVSALAHHALWDSWVHERDILLPQGIAPAEEADEIAASLRYVAALGPALAIGHGATERGSFAVHTTDPAVSFVVDIDDTVHVHDGEGDPAFGLGGGSVELLEALSVRAPLRASVPSGAAWMLRGLLETFDAAD